MANVGLRVGIKMGILEIIVILGYIPCSSKHWVILPNKPITNAYGLRRVVLAAGERSFTLGSKIPSRC